MIEIDGSYLEGGGQILRTACALSALTKKPCRVFNIRKNRPKVGLMPQHLLGIRALAEFCNGKLQGDELGSELIEFYPGETCKNQILLQITTAGSASLLLQTVMPPAIFSLTAEPIKITIEGGATDTFFSPTIDYFQHVFIKILEKMGAKIEINVQRRGYFPEGGARIEAIIHPSKLKYLNLTERGGLKKISAISGASEFLKNKKVAERQLQGVKEVLGKLALPLEEKAEYYKTQCPGSQICLVAEFYAQGGSASGGENTIIGVDNLGKLGKRAEDVGKEAALELLKEQKTGACFDRKLADQILPYLALSPANSSITVSEITRHCQTNIWVIEKFLDGHFTAKENLISWISK